MNSKPFNPNDITIPNGSFFGFPYSVAEADLVLLPVPWDVTTSYREGTANGPQAILDASVQLDWYDFDLPQAWQTRCGTIPINAQIQAQNRAMRAIAKTVIEYLEAGGQVNDDAITKQLAIVNQASADLNHWVYQQASEQLDQGKVVGVVGGDHSVPLGLMQALAQRYENYGILQIDAHADLRQAYEGFTYSHASIMYNALKLPPISRLVQIGIRDVCEAEMKQVNSDRTLHSHNVDDRTERQMDHPAEHRIIMFDDWQLKAKAYEGIPWASQCQDMICHLPDNVYVSFDIDGLNPSYCPHTGTPVPGGLEFNEAIFLLRALVEAGKTIIGFDLCEVAPGKNEDQWDGNVGARILYKLACLQRNKIRNA